LSCVPKLMYIALPISNTLRNKSCRIGPVLFGTSEVLAFPHKQSTEDLQRFLDAFLDHDMSDRLPGITAPTLVLAGERDPTARPPLCRAVAELISGARFEVMEEEAHQPFQEVPDEWNARVDAFWREVEARG